MSNKTAQGKKKKKYIYIYIYILKSNILHGSMHSFDLQIEQHVVLYSIWFNSSSVEMSYRPSRYELSTVETMVNISKFIYISIYCMFSICYNKLNKYIKLVLNYLDNYKFSNQNSERRETFRWKLNQSLINIFSLAWDPIYFNVMANETNVIAKITITKKKKKKKKKKKNL